MQFFYHIQDVKFSKVGRLATRRGVFAVQQLSSVLRYYCFNILQQNWVAKLLLLTFTHQTNV